MFQLPPGSTLTQVQGLIDVIDLIGDFSTTPGSISASVITTSLLKATTDVLIGSDLDFQNTYNLLRCPLINGIRPSGGVYSESYGFTLSGVQTETPMLMTGVHFGTLTVPANTYLSGDTYGLKVGGKISCDNNDTFILRLKMGTATLWTINVSVDGAQVNDWFEIEVEFIVRAIGPVATASISTNGHYSYFNNTNVSKGYGVDSVNNTTFDTTVDNTLQLTYETSNSTLVFTISQVALTKLF